MKLIGSDGLNELDFRDVDMQRELEKVFTKYEDFFEMNGMVKSDPNNNKEVETATQVRLKAKVLRQYIRDAALEVIWLDPADRTKIYEQLRDKIIKKLKPKVTETLVHV